MAKSLPTVGTNHHLEELIKGTSDRLKELLRDKNRLKIGGRFVSGILV